MRKNLLAFLIVIIVLVLNVVLVSVLVLETDRTGDGAHNFPSLEVAVKLIPNSSASDLSNLLSVTSSSFSDSSFSPSPEKLAITMVKENVRSSTFVVTVSNDGSQNVSIDSIFVNYYSAKIENKVIIPAFSSVNLLFTFSEGIEFGHTYEIRILSAEGFSADYFKIIC